MEKQEYIKTWADKLSLTVEEVEKEYNEILSDEKEIHKDLSVDQQEMRALKRIALAYKKQMRSPAVGFEGIVIATSDAVDIVAKQKREALEMFRTNPQLAIEEGITNEMGIPLDTKQVWASGKNNPKFGKPLPIHNYLRNVWGVAKKSKDDSNPKLFQMMLSGDKANQEILTFASLRFAAIDRSEASDLVYRLNASSFTKFVEDDNIKMPTPEEIIKQYYSITQLSNLKEYHQQNKDDFNRITLIEGDVSMLNLEPTSMGSRIMVLEDESSFEDLDKQGLTCWMPERINIDFAEGSKVIVIGRTAQGKKKDEQGNATDELGDVTLNVYGVYALPNFKIELPEELKPITEESLDIE